MPVGARFKSIVEEHPLFVSAGVLVVGMTIGAAPMQIAESGHQSEIQGLQSQVDRLETELGSVTRTVGEDSITELRTDEIVLSSNEAGALSPTSVEYFADDDFYAPALESHPAWSFVKTDEAGLYEMQGLDGDVLAQQLGEDVANQRLNLWRSAEETVVVDTAGSTVVLFPFVGLERLETERLAEMLGELLGTDAMRDFVEDDPLGAMFQLNVVTLVASVTEDFSAIMSGIQRTEDVLYCEVTLVLRNVTVDGADVGRFYVNREFLFLAAGDDVVAVITSLPSADRRSADAPVVTEILNGLHIVR